MFLNKRISFALTFILFLIVHFRDPGFIPTDSIEISDNLVYYYYIFKKNNNKKLTVFEKGLILQFKFIKITREKLSGY